MLNWIVCQLRFVRQKYAFNTQLGNGKALIYMYGATVVIKIAKLAIMIFII